MALVYGRSLAWPLGWLLSGKRVKTCGALTAAGSAMPTPALRSVLGMARVAANHPSLLEGPRAVAKVAAS